MAQITVVCPHCGSTGTYSHGLGSASGGTRPQCRSCHKTFQVTLHLGQVHSVKK
jgi:transposase-like protein